MDTVPAHPGFLAQFSHPLYVSESDDFAPFGSDEGSDLLHTWAARISDLQAEATLRTILVDDSDDPDRLWAEFRQPDPPAELDSLVISGGFVLLRLTGAIDDVGRTMLIRALLRSREHSPAGAGQFDQMIGDLGGEVPTTPAMTDDLREMLDPNFGPPPERRWWLHLDRGFDVRPPQSYSQHLSWLQRALNDDPAWWEWWDAGFPGELAVLMGWISFADKPRRASVRSKVQHQWREVDVSLRVSTRSFAALDRQELAQYSLTFVREARTAVSDILDAAAKKFGLGPSPEIPVTKRETGPDPQR